MTDANSEAAIRAIIDARVSAVRAGDVEALMVDVADDVHGSGRRLREHAIAGTTP